MTLPRTVSWKNKQLNQACKMMGGFEGICATGSLPDGMFADAVNTDDGFGVEMAALGKPAGDIFNPEHWIYNNMER